MNPALIDEASGVHETDAAAQHSYPKIRLVDAVVTAALFVCLAAYAVIGGMWLFLHLL